MLLLEIGVESEVLLPFDYGERRIQRVELDNLDIAGIEALPRPSPLKAIRFLVRTRSRPDVPRC
jgi:hypothetical protein